MNKSDSNPEYFPIVLLANDRGRGICPKGFWAIYRDHNFNMGTDLGQCNVLTSNQSIKHLYENEESQRYANFLKDPGRFSIVNKTHKIVTFYSEPEYKGEACTLGAYRENGDLRLRSIASVKISDQESTEVVLEMEEDESESPMYMGMLKGKRACPLGYLAFFEYVNFNNASGGRCLLSRVPFSTRFTMFGNAYGCTGSIVNRTNFEVSLYAPDTPDGVRGARLTIKPESELPNLERCKFIFYRAKRDEFEEFMLFATKQLVSTVIGKLSPIPFLLSPLSNAINKELDKAWNSADQSPPRTKDNVFLSDEADYIISDGRNLFKIQSNLKDHVESIIFNGLKSYADLPAPEMRFPIDNENIA